MTTQLLQQALDALKTCNSNEGDDPWYDHAKVYAARDALREALAAPQASPPLDGFGGNLDAAFDATPVPDGMVMVPREPTEDMIQAAADAWGRSEGGLHNAFTAALRGGIAASPATPVVLEPLTDEQILSMWKSSEFRGKGGQADWFCEGIRAAEAHHGITGGSK